MRLTSASTDQEQACRRFVIALPATRRVLLSSGHRLSGTSRRVAGVARKGAQQAKMELRPGGGVTVTKPNDFDEFRRDQERQVRRWQMTTGVIDVLTVLTLLAIGALVLRIIFR
jgi:hypothetical protein